MTEHQTLLVVDDNDAGRFVKVQTLRRAGFEVLEASTGAEALTVVDSRRPALVVLDVNLPDISGFQVARRLRERDISPALQILQISSTAVESADRVRGLQEGADVYLLEPIESEVLVATVHSLLRVRRAEAAMAAALESERRAREIAEEAAKVKEEFIATLSHELRTPLNACMGWIWQLRHTKLGDQAYERALDSLERNARMQAQLINDLLDVSRVSKGKLQLQMRLLDLCSVIEDVAESLAEPIEQKHLRLHLDLHPACVAGDEARLQQIVTNLMTNAVQFTPVNGQLSIEVKVEGSDAVLTFEDSGVGIEAGFLPYVFDQFRQGEGGLSRKHGGLGLGLTVVQQLVELHGGSVTVSSPGLGKGSRFTVRLPHEKGTADGRAVADPPLMLSELRVLIDVRNPVEAETLGNVLESSGASVSVAHSRDGGKPADSEPDIVVTDDPDGSLRLRVRGSSGAPASVPKSLRPSELVRRLGRLMADTTVS